MKTIKTVLLLILLQSGYPVLAQQVKAGMELLEILRISETYRLAPNLSYSMTYTYADSANQGNPIEQMYGSSKISDGRYWSMLDSVEFLQGYQHGVTVMYADSTIVVNSRDDYGKIISLPFLDSVFTQANVDSMSIVVHNDSTYLLTVFFKPEASYRSYKIYYDKNKLLVRKIDYYLKNQVINEETIGTVLISLTLSNYSLNTIDPEIFREDRFIYKSNGVFYGKGVYDGFNVINNTRDPKPEIYN